MKILIAIDSFKGSISSLEGSKAIALGIKEAMVAELDDGLNHFSNIVQQAMGIDIHSFPGAGAGGLGAAQ
ncbi:glycerate kinase [Bacillus sp. JJ1562]|uniref:glycerate kinase n=1 Tax=Bacillus sp. JJ1562 TaxID=3122960 RepID=UPI0030031CF3